jgi:TRAP-type C4-dicarboxylate transport system substrate-binding protein
MRAWLALWLSLGPSLAAAEPAHVFRMASEAPEGTAWAREIRAFAREVESATHGFLRIKWFLGGIAGDEVQVAERIHKDQLDGAASGGMLCARLAPSMRVLSVLGLFRDRDEAVYVLGRLKPTLDAEFLHNGFVNLAELGVGPSLLFTRQPVQSLAELRRTSVWIWDLDEVLRLEMRELGIPAVPLPLSEAARAFDRGTLDGFVSVPAAALAFQWSTQARYLVDLRVNMVNGCLLVAARAFDLLPLEVQQVVRVAAARGAARLEALGRSQDDALLGGLFARQGMKPVPVSERFRSEFADAAQAARERLGRRLVPDALMLRVTGWLADFRSAHVERPR